MLYNNCKRGRNRKAHAKRVVREQRERVREWDVKAHKFDIHYVEYVVLSHNPHTFTNIQTTRHIHIHTYTHTHAIYNVHEIKLKTNFNFSC